MAMPENATFEERSESKIKLPPEKGRFATFINNDRKTYRIFKINISQEKTADYVVEKPSVGQIVVELKGVDVGHATEQVAATARIFINQSNYGKISGLIVCKKYPSFDTIVQKATAEFRKKFKGRLHVVSRNKEYKFEELL